MVKNVSYQERFCLHAPCHDAGGSARPASGFEPVPIGSDVEFHSILQWYRAGLPMQPTDPDNPDLLSNGPPAINRISYSG